MENNKYYQPEIEEFHVGFELEVGNKASKGKSTKWTKSVIESDEDLFYNYLKGYVELRVKYLSKECIEELGFKNKPTGYENGLLSKYEYGLITSDDIIKIQTYWHYSTRERENLIRIFKGKKYKYPYEEIFRGDIKNKSELKKILKMIDIK